MPTIPEALSLAVSYHQAGQWPQAEQLYRQILQVDPQQAPAWHLLGVLAHQVGNNDVAIDYIGRAIALNPFVGEFHYNLGTVYQAAGRADQAVPCFRQALQLEPNSVNALTNLGKALEELDQFEEAIAVYQAALQREPHSAKLHYNLGIAFRRQGHPDKAVTYYRRALQLQPDMALAHNNLGAVLQKQGAFDEAVACFRKALALVPDYVEAYNNLGKAYHDRGHWAEAEPCYRRALEIQSNFADTHINLAMFLLTHGRFAEGWREYEWRWQTKLLTARSFQQPQWNGASLAGKTILLHPEQGAGDVLQFIRYAPILKQMGATVLVECPAALVPLVKTCRGVDICVASGSLLPPFDVHAPLLSLPGTLGTSLATIPAEIPYLFADSERVRSWRERLASIPGLRIGICWQGSKEHQKDEERSVRLTQFAPLAEVGGVQLLSLQVGSGAEQLRDPALSVAVTDLAAGFDATTFVDAAAAVSCLDMVITVDTAIAHLAGALGMPVWIAVPFVPDWRWLLDRDDSPWYPTARLFRQKKPGDWNDVFARMAEALRQHLATRAGHSRRHAGAHE